MGLFDIFSPTRRKAKRIINEAEDKYCTVKYEFENARDRCNTAICNLGELKLQIASNTIISAHHVFQRIRKNIKVSQIKISKIELKNFEQYTLPEINQVGMTASNILKVGAKGAAASTSLACGAYGLVSTLGTASTGTAISALSGAAATNATLAWFGGGAVGAGGLGMSAGTAVLGGVAFVPMALIGMLAFSAESERRLTEATEYAAKVDVAVKQMYAVVEVTKRIITEVDKFQSVLKRLNGLLATCIAKLEVTADKVDAGGKADKNEIILFYSAVLLTKTIKKLLSDNLFDEQGEISPNVKESTAHADALLNQDISTCQVVSDLSAGKRIKVPSQPIQPGSSSDVYFWTSDINSMQKVGFLLGIGIFLFPPLSLLTLRKGYSLTARLLSIGWLIFVSWAIIDDISPKKIEVNAPSLVKEVRVQEPPASTKKIQVVSPPVKEVRVQEAQASTPKNDSENVQKDAIEHVGESAARQHPILVEESTPIRRMLAP